MSRAPLTRPLDEHANTQARGKCRPGAQGEQRVPSHSTRWPVMLAMRSKSLSQ